MWNKDRSSLQISSQSNVKCLYYIQSNEISENISSKFDTILWNVWLNNYTENKRCHTELFLKRILNLAKGFVKIHDPLKILVIDWRVFYGGFVELFMVWYETYKGSEFVSKFETFISSEHLTEPFFTSRNLFFLY